MSTVRLPKIGNFKKRNDLFEKLDTKFRNKKLIDEIVHCVDSELQCNILLINLQFMVIYKK